MNTTRTDEDWDFQCRETNKLIKALGGSESVGEFLGRNSQTVRKWARVDDDQALTLRHMMILEREAVEIGKEPSLSIAHLRRLGYVVSKPATDDCQSREEAALTILQNSGQLTTLIADALSDLRIDDMENEEIRDFIDSLREKLRTYAVARESEAGLKLEAAE